MPDMEIKLKRPENIPLRHLVLLGLLIALYAGAGTAAWMEASSRMQALEQEKSRIMGDMARKRRELQGIQERIKTLKGKRDLYLRLYDQGFIGEPDRLRGIAALRETAKAHRVFDLEYSFQPREVLAVARASDKDRAVLSTPLKVTVSALLDSDIYGFLAALRQNLPGQLMLRDLTVTRQGDVDRDLLARLRQGNQPALVKGTLKLRWNTLRWPRLKKDGDWSGETS